MTISSTDDPRAGPFNGNGSQTVFPFVFKTFAKADLLVVRTDDDGLEYTLVLDSDYSVSLNADQDANPGGSITYPISGSALPLGETLTIASNLDFIQTTDIQNSGGFFAEVIEDALDRQVMLIKQVNEKVDRALRVAVSTPVDVSLELPVPVANNFIGWDDAAKGLRNVDPATLGTIIAFAQWQSQTFNGNGSATQFVLSTDPGSINNMDVSISGVTQTPGVDYALSGTTITFASAPASGTGNILVRYGQALAQGTSDAASAVYTPPGTGAVDRTVEGRLRDFTSVKDFGPGVGIGNATADTLAFVTALASGKNIYIPEGTYYVSSSLTVGAGVKMYGAGRGKTTIVYTGTAHGILLGNTEAGIDLCYDPECGGFTLVCTNRASTVNGVLLQNAVYFRVFDMTIIGSGSPNSATPADRVLYGAGLVVTHNSILGSVDRVSCRIWDKGYYFYTKATSGSHWAAAIEVHGGEVATNMYGIVIGDPAVAFPSGSGVSFHDIWVQGNYTTGIKNYSGESVLFDNVYFEGNANYDYDVGGGAANPVKNMLYRCSMATEDIGVTPYGNFPYLAKARIRAGSFNSIVDNNMSISTAIPLVIVDAAAEATHIKMNRLNSTAATTARLQNGSGTTITEDNSPEAPRVAIGSLTRTLSAATATVAYTGLGFKPTSIEFVGAVDTTNERTVGWAGLTGNGLEQRCVSTDASGANLSSSDCIRIIRSSAGNEQKASLASFDADGFSLNWTLVGTPPGNTLVVNFIARR